MQHRPVVTAYLIASALALLASAPLTASDDHGTSTEDDHIELFDDDVELTDKGWSRFNIAAGVTRIDADGVFAASLPNREPVTIINFDRVGLKETDDSHWLSMTWRSDNSRWGAWFGNWRYDVTGTRTWEDELVLPSGPSIPVGAEVATTFDANWYILEATYSFVRTRDIDAGIGFGLHTVDIDTELTARIAVGGGEHELVRSELDTMAPLPNVLAYFYWGGRSRWDLIGRVGWFGLDYDKYSGRMINAHIMLSYSVIERLALGMAYQFVNLDVDIDQKHYRQMYDIDFDGPMVFARLRF